MNEMNEMNGTNEKAAVKKPPIRFYRPFNRILTAVLPFLAISMFFGAFVYLFSFSDGRVMSAIALIIYLVIQYFVLKKYLKYSPSKRRYLCTNILANAVLLVLAVGSLILSVLFMDTESGGTLYTLLFMPLKIFYYFGWMGKLFSAILACGIIGVLAVEMPRIRRWLGY